MGQYGKVRIGNLKKGSSEMEVSEILQILTNYKAQSANRYGISRLGIFGSYAKGSPTQKSDRHRDVTV